VRTVKREEYLSWDEYFMGIAVLSAKRSKDPSTQVGACIVNKDKRIISVGYNGMPRCCSDDEFPWDKNENPLDSKYLYVCHAELNAILNCDRGNVRDCICYTTLFPCNECAKAIIQSGMSEVVYMEDKYADSDSVIASKKMFDTAGVKYRLYNKSGKEVNINL
jgi:dCMP deaminase